MRALRAATVGVSLCDAETSVAAPITARTAAPSAVVTVLMEGRCSLITAYTLIMFNIMYGSIQLFMASILYGYGLVLGDYMYLTQDLVFTLGCGLALSNNLPADSLSVTMPPKRFVTKYFVVKLSLQMLCFLSFQLIAMWFLSMQPFYTKYDPVASGDKPLTATYSFEATTIDCMALAQLSIASIAASIGLPFRSPWYRNPWHVGMLIFQICWVIVQTLARSGYILENILEIKPLPLYFAGVLLGIMTMNFIVSLALTLFTDVWFNI
jgi:magnesium-transporting ATPase (P-type)